MAIQNEGGATAFITCSPVTLQGVQSVDFGHGLYIAHSNASQVTVNCTGVQGARSGAADLAVPKSVTINANSNASIYWTGADGFDPLAFHGFNTSCSIAPGVGITTVYVNQVLDIGT
jgi:hypothetical protein